MGSCWRRDPRQDDGPRSVRGRQSANPRIVGGLVIVTREDAWVPVRSGARDHHMGSNRAAIEVNRGYPARMATITGATGGSWEPALRTTVRNVAAQQQVIQSWGDAMARQRTQWAALAKQVSQVRQQTSQISEAARRASEVSRSISMLQPQLQAWRQHQEQIVRTVRLLQDLPSLRM